MLFMYLTCAVALCLNVHICLFCVPKIKVSSIYLGLNIEIYGMQDANEGTWLRVCLYYGALNDLLLLYTSCITCQTCHSAYCIAANSLTNYLLHLVIF